MCLAPRLLTPPHHTAFGCDRQRATGGALLAVRLVTPPGLRLALALFAIDLGTELGRLALQLFPPHLALRLGHLMQRLAIPPDLLAFGHRSAPYFRPTAFWRFASSP